MRILIAEDDAVSRQYLYRLMKELGECDLVVDGLETLEAFSVSIKEGRPYDLICLDIMMPKLDGVKVLKAIREYEFKKDFPPDKRVKVILITALAKTDSVRRAFEIGCEGYITKPYEADKLLEQVKNMGFY
ncbi:MAG: response regulator [Bacillota bacterium]